MPAFGLSFGSDKEMEENQIWSQGGEKDAEAWTKEQREREWQA